MTYSRCSVISKWSKFETSPDSLAQPRAYATPKASRRVMVCSRENVHVVMHLSRELHYMRTSSWCRARRAKEVLNHSYLTEARELYDTGIGSYDHTTTAASVRGHMSRRAAMESSTG